MGNTDKIRLVFFLLVSVFGLTKNDINTDSNLVLLSEIHLIFFHNAYYSLVITLDLISHHFLLLKFTCTIAYFQKCERLFNQEKSPNKEAAKQQQQQNNSEDLVVG